jgi:aquaporin Z
MSDTNKYIIEAVGTFFFLSVIMHSLNDNGVGPQGVAIALLASIYFGASVSGAHFNPAVSFAMFLENKLTLGLMSAYILSQLVGAAAAWKFNSLFLKNVKTF